MAESMRVRNPGGRAVDVTGGWFEENRALFSSGGWRVVRKPQTRTPERAATGEEETPWPHRKRGVVVHIFPWPLQMSGALVFCLELARWAGDFADVHILAKKAESESVALCEGVFVHLVRNEDEGEALLREISPDLVHHHHPSGRWLFGGMDFSRGVVGTAHGHVAGGGTGVSWIVPISGESPNLIRHGVDLAHFRPSPSRRLRGRLRVGVVGRISPEKIPSSFLRELARRHDDDMEFHFVGSASGIKQNELLEEKLRSIGSPRVRLFPAVKRESLPALYSGFDLLLVPSVTESVCLAAVEAMACGTPVLARKVGGLSDTLGDAGILCQDDKEIFEKLRYYAERRWALKGLSEAARKRVEKLFDINRMFEQYGRLYAGRSVGRIRCDKITASLASIPRRVESLRRTVESLLPQVDRLNVYLNGHPFVPEFLNHEKIQVLHRGTNDGAIGKLHWATDPGYHLICDDDIVYPPDYAARMTEAVERYERKAICGVAGLNFPKGFSSYFHDRIPYQYQAGLEHDTRVKLVCTGCMAFHSDLGLGDLKEYLKMPNQIDPHTALWAHRRDIPRIAVARPDGWLSPWADPLGGLLESYKHTGNESEQTRIIREILDDQAPAESETTAVVYRGQVGIGNFIFSTPFLQNLENPILFFDQDFQWLEQVKSISPWPVRDYPGIEKVRSEFQKVFAPWGGVPGISHRGNVAPNQADWSIGLHESQSYLDGLVGAKRYDTMIKTEPCREAFPGEKKTLKIVMVNGSNPLPHWKLKRWPPERFAELAKKIYVDYDDAQICFLGDENDGETGRALEAVGVLNLSGQLTFAQSADVMKQADMVICNDTGLMHAADAVGTRIVALFGFTPVSKNRPWNGNATIIQSRGGDCPHWPCYGRAAHGQCRRFLCMEAISVDEVWAISKKEIECLIRS